ncbi:MAG: ribosome biogenesis GTP-binding protein YihA/YsxC [Coraliomargaritaceae bacterium]
MKIETVRTIGNAMEMEDCPSVERPEFAFVGRSNVGKSSLINMLTGRSGLAHTSSQPGKTRRMHFYCINESWHLVDLPGYGYARVSKAEKGRFNQYVSAYLNERNNLQQVFLLVDSQLPPQDGDLSFAYWLKQCGLPFSLVFTKSDKLSGSRLTGNAGLFLRELADAEIEPVKDFACSAKTARGRGELLSFIGGMLPKKPKKKKSSGVQLGWMKRS